MTTPDAFRRLAVALPGASEGAHHGHADFRANGRVFATLGWPDAGWGVLMLSPDEQEMRCSAAPDIFSPVPGGWGRHGHTRVQLAHADEPTLAGALACAHAAVLAKPKGRARR